MVVKYLFLLVQQYVGTDLLKQKTVQKLA